MYSEKQGGQARADPGPACPIDTRYRFQVWEMDTPRLEGCLQKNLDIRCILGDTRLWVGNTKWTSRGCKAGCRTSRRKHAKVFGVEAVFNNHKYKQTINVDTRCVCRCGR